jgi:putative heme iron utilization protein
VADGGPSGPAPPPARAAPPYDALAEAKRLLRSVRAGALATLDSDGHPFASLVSVATQPDGSPLLLLSRLAAHTRHIEADPRCSLMLAQGGKGDPLAHPRLSLLARAERIEAEDVRNAARMRFLARQPKASLYIDFPDFALWRLDLSSAHLNGGFARAARFEAAELLTPVAGRDDLLAAEAGAVTHMNQDHKDAIGLYATVLAHAGPGDWRASGIDPEGIDLICGDRVARVAFARPVDTPGDLRAALTSLAEMARAECLAETLPAPAAPPL